MSGGVHEDGPCLVEVILDFDCLENESYLILPQNVVQPFESHDSDVSNEVVSGCDG